MPKLPRTFFAHVTSAGVTPKTATVRLTVPRKNNFLRTRYTIRQKMHIADPTNSLHTHDVVKVGRWPGLSRTSAHSYTVLEIVAPWGPTLEQRPPLLTEEGREQRRRQLGGKNLEAWDRKQEKKGKGRKWRAGYGTSVLTGDGEATAAKTPEQVERALEAIDKATDGIVAELAATAEQALEVEEEKEEGEPNSEQQQQQQQGEAGVEARLDQLKL